MKVFVGLSGGVDSAVSAALLKAAGHEVTGAFIKIWRPEFIECTWARDRLDAMRVAAALEIPFREIDLSDEYKQNVIDDMTRSYAAGSTPNPDVLCNSTIKFGAFAKWALSEGADCVATGHYARIVCQDNILTLRRGADLNKDQTYFLHRLGQNELSRTLFPIGGDKKDEVRALAKKFALPNAARPDSQGLCFVGDVSIEDFLARYLELKSGEVQTMDGTVIGTHRGAALYTIGQRHGFSADGSQPHFVTGIDTKRNILTVSTKRTDAERSDACVSRVHWIRGAGFAGEASAQARYRETPVNVQVRDSGNGTRISFAKPHVIARGQSLVLYRGDECLGGGSIDA